MAGCEMGDPMLFLALFGAMALVMGLVAVTFAVRFIRSERHFERTGVQVVGHVVGEERSTRRSEGGVTTFYFPVVQYQTVDGRRLRASTEVNTQHRSPIGAQVKIRYLTDEPTRIRLIGESLPRRVSAIVLAVGVLVTLLGLVCLTASLAGLTG
jgi:hypothetical protein